jgi:hypothetical protein
MELAHGALPRRRSAAFTGEMAIVEIGSRQKQDDQMKAGGGLRRVQGCSFLDAIACFQRLACSILTLSSFSHPPTAFPGRDDHEKLFYGVNNNSIHHKRRSDISVFVNVSAPVTDRRKAESSCARADVHA